MQFILDYTDKEIDTQRRKVTAQGHTGNQWENKG